MNECKKGCPQTGLKGCPIQESSTQFRLLAGLATGGGILSIVSLLRMIFGGPP